MNKLGLKTMVLAASMATTAMAQQMPDPFSQPGPAIEARQGVHKLMGANLQDVGMMVQGAKEFDGFRLLERIEGLNALASMSYDMFMVEGSVEGSKSNEKIHTQKEAFKKLFIRFKSTTQGLVAAAHNHDNRASMVAVQNIVAQCEGCHAEYMQPAAQ
jgi:cytochrome c556